MRVLITGGAGFIGSRLAATLASRDAQVVVFDSFHPQVHHAFPQLPAGVQVHPGDVRDPESWDRCFLRHGHPDTIVHLAAETGTGQSLTEASRHGSTNVVGTTRLTDALVRHDCLPGHIMIASSRAVYGEGAWRSQDGSQFYPAPRSASMLNAAAWDPVSPDGGICVPQPHAAATTWPHPTNVYAATKLAQEHVLESWCAAYEVPLTILRLQNVFGPGQAVGNAYTGVLTHFARQITTNQQIEVYEDGQILRDFVFVDDVISAFVQMMAPTTASGVRRIDIGGGQATALWEVASLMCEFGGAAAPIVSGRFRLGDVRAASADISTARLTGWVPRKNLRDGLAALLSWVAEQP